MRKLFKIGFWAVVFYFLLSCEKEPEPVSSLDCKCGTIIGQGSYYADTFKINVVYWIDVQNYCSKNVKRKNWIATNTPKEWSEATSKNKYCFSNDW